MTPRGLGGLAAALAVAVVASGGAFALVADRPGVTVAGGLLSALRPGGALLVVVWMAWGRRLASWTALVGAALVLALGVALYAAALASPRPAAVRLAADLVPLRQLAAVAVAAWAVWITRGR